MVYTEIMARYPRLVVPGLPHHVTQRGNRRQRVFRSQYDLSKYCSIADRCLYEAGVRVLAFCLMPNHVHFILVPPESDSLSKAVQRMHTSFSLYSNLAWQNCGHLWQGRFYSCALDATHLYNAIRYVEMNPVRAGLVQKPSLYRWSSARAHVFGHSSPIELDTGSLVAALIDDWDAYLNEASGDDFSMLRDRTKTGRPCCTLDMCHRIEEETGRTVLTKSCRFTFPENQ